MNTYRDAGAASQASRNLLDGLRWLAGLAFFALLLFFPAGALASARDAMILWADAVAPAVFPFMAVLPLLTSPAARRLYARLLGGPVRLLLRLPGEAAAALAVSLLAGSPAGALACARAAGGLRRGEFKRLALMTPGPGPVYLISGVGTALLGDRWLGLLLAAVQVLVQLLTGILLRPLFREERERLPEAAPTGRETPLRGAVLNALQIAGYMALFAVLAGFAARLLGAKAGLGVRLLLDLPGGAAQLARLPLPMEVRLCLIAAASGFGGVCIAAQNMAVLGPLGLRWREYLSVKAAQGLLSAALCRIGLRLLPAGTESPAVFGLPPLRLAALAMLPLLAFAAWAFRSRPAGDAG